MGVEIRTNLGRRGALFTNDISFFVLAALDGETVPKWADERIDWKGVEELIALSRDPS